LITNALGTVDNAESLLKIKNLVALFMQAMDVSYSVHRLKNEEGGLTIEQTWNFSVSAFDKLLLTLFGKYADLLKKRFSDDFQEVRETIHFWKSTVTNLF
jgi:hypothetical protein